MGMEVFDPNAERIVRRAEAENETSIIYTVPANSFFWLEECDLSPWGLTVGFAAIFLRDELDATIRGLASITIMSEIGALVSDHAVFPSFIKCLAGQDICVISDAVNLDAMGSISGFLTSDYS